MKKLFVYCLVFIIWCNTGWTNDNNDDLTDNQIKKILKKMTGPQKTEEFLQCVEIVRGSNIKRRFLRHQIKKIKCRLKYEELNAKD